MPELPEVETVRRILVKNLIGKTINQVNVYYDGVLENVNKVNFCESLLHETFKEINRVGKYLIFILETKSLVVHLRMEGKFFFKPYGDILSTHEHVEFVLNTNEVLRYHDTRKFGKFVLLDTTNMEDIMKYPALIKLGEDANKITDFTNVYKKLSSYRGTLKAALLDQTIMAGIGNIYADEICFLTRFHPETKCNLLTIHDIKNIVDASEYVLHQAIKQGGTTIRSYTSSLGVTGRFQQSLLVHSKEGEKCVVCENKIIKTRVAGRGTYFCPSCQTFKDDIRIIGLTGVIASGKTEITKFLRLQNIKVIDADEINREILTPNSKYYSEIFDKVKNVFPQAITNNIIDKRILREIIFNDSNLRKILESIVYPIIKKIIIIEIKKEKFDIINNNKEHVMFVSAPLLLESGFDTLCTDIIIVDVDKEIQIKRIMNRDNVSYEEAKVASSLRMDIKELVELASLKLFDAYVLPNNNDLDSLYQETSKVLKTIMEETRWV